MSGERAVQERPQKTRNTFKERKEAGSGSKMLSSIRFKV